MSDQPPKSKIGRRHALTLVLIATIGSIIVAAVKIIPSLTGGKNANPTTSTTASGSGSIAVTGDGTTISINSNDKLENLLKERIPITAHPVVDLSKPIEQQVQLFPEDKVRIPGLSHRITRVWFGGQWHPFDYDRDYSHVYTVWGTSGEPVTPKFDSPDGVGEIKLEISYTRYLDKPRDLRGSQPASHGIVEDELLKKDLLELKNKADFIQDWIKPSGYPHAEDLKKSIAEVEDIAKRQNMSSRSADFRDFRTLLDSQSKDGTERRDIVVKRFGRTLTSMIKELEDRKK